MSLLDDMKARLEQWLAIAAKRVRTDGERASIEFTIIGESRYWLPDDEEGFEVTAEEKFSTDHMAGAIKRGGDS